MRCWLVHWKMISMGTQGKMKPEDQIKALNIYVNKLDISMAKPLLVELYPSKLTETIISHWNLHAIGSRKLILCSPKRQENVENCCVC